MGGVRCARCGGLIHPSEPWDLGHVDGSKSRYAGAEHRSCNRATAAPGRRQLFVPADLEPDPEPVGLEWGDPRWRVAWLKGLRRPPADAVWPRLMSVPHRRAAGSLGPEFIRWAEARSERSLRWWQRLAATRMLEVDSDDRLVWETILLTVPRQLGKSWLLRELAFWRMHQSARFGEPQDVLHTGKDLEICVEVQRPARVWAKQRPEYRVREANGRVEIELLSDGSRWKLHAKESVYGFSVSLATADEAWKVKPQVIEEGVDPTMVEREQPQLLLVSTAHRMSTSLMLGRRQVALDSLESGDGILLIEWSAPADAAIDDPEVWRQASAQWSPRREKTVRERLDGALAGTARTEDEPDPIESFRAQWLNQWPKKLVEPTGDVEDLLPAGAWADLTELDVTSAGPVWVSVEDDYGLGSAVAAVGRTDDGRLELDGWRYETWGEAVEQVRRLAEWRTIRDLTVGASLMSAVPRDVNPKPRPSGAADTRAGLALFRDLAIGRALAHDETTEDLDEVVTRAQTKETPSGLVLVPQRGRTHLVKALVRAVAAAYKPAPVPSIH